MLDVYGHAVGRPVVRKIDIAQGYQFMMSFENDLHTGYVTEKPLDAWVSGCIPLWRGYDAAQLLNRDAFVNATDFPRLAEFVDQAGDIRASPAEFERMSNEPLARSEWNLRNALSKIEFVWRNRTSGKRLGHEH